MVNVMSIQWTNSSSTLRFLMITCVCFICLLVLIFDKQTTNTGSLSSLLLVFLPYQDNATEYKTISDGDQVQAIRRSKVIQTCMDHAGHAVLKPMNPYFSTKFYPASLTLDEDEGIGWCRIDKVATAPWYVLFLLLRSVPLDEIQVAMTLNSNVSLHHLLSKTKTTPNERIHIVKGEHKKEFFNFLVVRHPFVRLVSAYRDKLENLTEKVAQRKDIRRVFSSAHSPTFSEFVEYLIRTPPNLMDRYWAPYSKVCSPCTNPYSAVLKMETLDQDTDWMFKKWSLEKLREDWEKVAKMRKSIVASEHVVGKYFSQISKEDIMRLYNKYKVDFVMFDYDKDIEQFVLMGK